MYLRRENADRLRDVARCYTYRASAYPVMRPPLTKTLTGARFAFAHSSFTNAMHVRGLSIMTCVPPIQIRL